MGGSGWGGCSGGRGGGGFWFMTNADRLSRAANPRLLGTTGFRVAYHLGLALVGVWLCPLSERRFIAQAVFPGNESKPHASDQPRLFSSKRDNRSKTAS